MYHTVSNIHVYDFMLCSQIKWFYLWKTLLNLHWPGVSTTGHQWVVKNNFLSIKMRNIWDGDLCHYIFAFAYFQVKLFSAVLHRWPHPPLVANSRCQSLHFSLKITGLQLPCCLWFSVCVLKFLCSTNFRSDTKINYKKHLHTHRFCRIPWCMSLISNLHAPLPNQPIQQNFQSSSFSEATCQWSSKSRTLALIYSDIYKISRFLKTGHILKHCYCTIPQSQQPVGRNCSLNLPSWNLQLCSLVRSAPISLVFGQSIIQSTPGASLKKCQNLKGEMCTTMRCRSFSKWSYQETRRHKQI